MENILLFLQANTPWFWVILTVILVIIESCTMGLTTIWFAAMSLLMVLVSLTRLPFIWQLLIFVMGSCVLLFTTRPLVLKKIQQKKIATNSDSLIGRKALVTAKITEFQKGTVKIDGVEWSAASKNGTEINEKTECKITEIKGNTLTVEPIDLNSTESN